jgi:hypothetical protein
MPSADVLVSLCIQGYASETSIVVVGTAVSGGLTNVSTPAPGDLPSSFSSSGEWDTSSEVFTQVVIASPGYYFATKPNLYIDQGNRKDYTITSVESTDSEGRLVQVTFSVSYKFPADNVSGDEIVLTANAVEYYNPAEEITGYQFNTVNVISQGGETRNFNIYGIEGATWDLQCEYIPGNINIVNTSGTIDSTGQAVVNVVFPATTNVNRTYTFTLTGDLASSFDTANGQTSTPSINQYGQSSLGLVFSTTLAHVTVGPPDVKYYLPYSIPQTVVYTVTATSNQTFTVANNPPPALDWTGQDPPTPPQDFNYTMVSQTFKVNNLSSPATLTATVVVDVNTPGSISKTSVLDLDNVLI